MLSFLVRRLGSAALMLLLVLAFTFFLIHLAPGEPARLFENPRMSPESREALRRLYGWDLPVYQQFVKWLIALLQGEWGASISQRRPVFEILMQRLGATSLLVFAAVGIEHVVGTVAGVWAARTAGSAWDRSIGTIALAMHAVPAFVGGLIAIEFLAFRASIFPPQHMVSLDHDLLSPLGQAFDIAHHLALPALALGLMRSGAVVKYVRNGMLEVMSQDYVRTARAKGLSEIRVLFVHALPNALGPLIQRLGLSLPGLLSGTIVLEVVFAWPGLGTAVYQAVLQRDYPVIMAATMLSGILVVAGTLAADLLHGWLDPRLREHYVA